MENKNLNKTINVEEVKEHIKMMKNWIDTRDGMLLHMPRTYRYRIDSMLDELLRKINGKEDTRVEEMEKRIRSYIDHIFRSLKAIKNVNFEFAKQVTFDYFGKEQIESESEFARKYGDEFAIVRSILAKVIRLGRHPISTKEASFVPEILEIKMLDTDYVSFEELKESLDVDYLNFLVSFNVTRQKYPYQITKDGKGIQKVSLPAIASKILSSGISELEDDMVFASYIEYYNAFNIEIEPEVFAEILERFEEEKCINEKNVSYTLDDVLTPKEIFMFVRKKSEIYKKLLEEATNGNVRSYLKQCLGIKD